MPPAQKICMLGKGYSDPVCWNGNQRVPGMDKDLSPFGDNALETQEGQESAQGREKKWLCHINTWWQALSSEYIQLSSEMDYMQAGVWYGHEELEEFTGICAGPACALENFLNIWYGRGNEEETKVLFILVVRSLWAQNNTRHFLEVVRCGEPSRLLPILATIMCKISVFLSLDGNDQASINSTCLCYPTLIHLC